MRIKYEPLRYEMGWKPVIVVYTVTSSGLIDLISGASLQGTSEKVRGLLTVGGVTFGLSIKHPEKLTPGGWIRWKVERKGDMGRVVITPEQAPDKKWLTMDTQDIVCYTLRWLGVDGGEVAKIAEVL